MAQYRRKLNKGMQHFINDWYKKHKDTEGGIFTPDKRRKLLGIRPKGRKVSPENIPNFWYDVRNSVQSGLSDLHLVSEVAHQNQLKEMFSLIPYSVWFEGRSKTDIAKLLSTIFSSQPRSRVMKVKGQLRPIENNEDDIWLAHLAYEIVLECFKFFKEHNLVTSMAHERLIEETDDMLNSEIGRAWFVPRGRRNIKF